MRLGWPSDILYFYTKAYSPCVFHAIELIFDIPVVFIYKVKIVFIYTNQGNISYINISRKFESI